MRFSYKKYFLLKQKKKPLHANHFSTSTYLVNKHFHLVTQVPRFPSWDDIILSFPTTHLFTTYNTTISLFKTQNHFYNLSK